MPIPTSQIPNIQRTDSTVLQDPSAAALPHRALSQAAAQVGSKARQLQDFKQRKEKAQFAGASASLDQNLNNAFDEYQIKMLKEGDETKWQDGWNEASNRVRSEFIEKSNLNGRQKAALGVQFEATNKGHTTTVKKQTTVREIQRSKAQVLDAAESDLEAGNFDAFKKKIDMGIEANLISHKERRVILDKGEERSDHYEVSSLIETDPELALDLLTDETKTGRDREFKNLSGPSRNSLIGAAKQAVVNQQVQLFNGMMLGVEKDELVHPDKVIQMAEEGKLSSGQAKSYINTYHSKVLPERDVNSYVDILTAINSYDAKSDPSTERFRDIMGSIYGQQKDDVKHLRSMLESKLTPGTATTGKSYKEGYKLLGDWFDSGVFGNTTMDPIEGGPLDQEAFEKAQRSRLELVDELDRFIAENPNAGGVEVFDHLSAYTQRSRVGSGINIMTEDTFPIDTIETNRRDAKIDDILNR